jgi:hypothetical protein
MLHTPIVSPRRGIIGSGYLRQIQYRMLDIATPFSQNGAVNPTEEGSHGQWDRR